MPTGIYIQNFVKIDPVVPEIRSRTDTHTDKQTDCNTPLHYQGRVIRNHMGGLKWHLMPNSLVNITTACITTLQQYSYHSVACTSCRQRSNTDRKFVRGAT